MARRRMARATRVGSSLVVFAARITREAAQQ
jgi:hypothetical protein